MTFLGISKKTKMNEESSRHFGKINTAQGVVNHNHSLYGVPEFAVLPLKLMCS